MNVRELRNCFGCFATGVTVVTWSEDDEVKKGITVNSFTSVSLDPPLVLVSIDKNARAYESLKDNNFIVNILSAGQEAVAWQFAGREQQGLTIEWEESELGPKIRDSLATIECKPWKEYDGGDHVLFIGEVQDYTYQEDDGLVFLKGKFRQTKAIENYVTD
ncbi:flavin reductase [Pontibacillus yanchengensis]|uniref:Flavin reductase n=2 Tax=Pontibacillus yanchengensis TaxID=462910 RepID=A0ACC7VER2_9BACI|nr:flavin reductase family protein [Pontibacillus yanchengensis]MYL32116.1 flavin reductase [Pontibacillus yanchengensis]MYL52696.1 flavin reductase [Pontibacillus yanchengensis]